MNRSASRPAPSGFQKNCSIFALDMHVEYSRESEGTFDISVGPLMKVWGFYKQSGHLADRERGMRGPESVGYQKVILDPKISDSSFREKGVELDPGGIGKVTQ